MAANGIEIFLLEQGEGPPVLLCHGWPERGLDCFPQSECGLAVLSGAAQ
jgi:pimeloyl-ACP methyl ester carboxylesterase